MYTNIYEANISLLKAKDAKDDEFYTKYKDVAKEMKNYNWNGKVITSIPDTEELIGLPISIIKNVDPNNMPFDIIEKRSDLKLNGRKMFTRVIVKLK